MKEVKLRLARNILEISELEKKDYENKISYLNENMAWYPYFFHARKIKRAIEELEFEIEILKELLEFGKNN